MSVTSSVLPSSTLSSAVPTMTRLPRVLVMTATYNEIENLPDLSDEIWRYLPTADLLVVDDNSPDGTGQWVKDKIQSENRLHLLQRTGKQGLGTAIIAGMRWAIDNNYDYVVNVDADFSHHPRYLPAVVNAMTPANGQPVDVVIGSRYASGGGVTGWPLKRHLMSRCVNLYARWFLWLNTLDCSGGFRCYRTATLAKLNFADIQSRGYSFQEEILWRLRKIGATFAEVPIIFTDRERGQSKINQTEAWNAIKIIAKLGMFGK